MIIAENSKVGLPVIGSNVTVENACSNGSAFIGTSKSVLIGEFCDHQFSPGFLHLVKTLKLGSEEIFLIDRVLNLLDKNFHKLPYDTKYELIISLCNHLYRQNVESREKSIISISNCRHVELKRNYEGFPNWSFGVHPKVTRNTMLLGYLMVQPLYGVLLLKDSNYGMPCIICNITEEDVLPLIDSYVLISNYTVITEVYKDCDSFEYILVKLEAVKFLLRPETIVPPLLSELDTIEEQKYQNCLTFSLIGKSEVRHNVVLFLE